MEIKKGYTREQFIDYMEESKTPALTELLLIRQYNKFLKQPLKKKIQKILVDKFKIHEDSRYNDRVYLKGVEIGSIDFRGKWYFEYETYGDLFQATKGGLELQNVDL